jgi:hypothetical protein
VDSPIIEQGTGDIGVANGKLLKSAVGQGAAGLNADVVITRLKRIIAVLDDVKFNGNAVWYTTPRGILPEAQVPTGAAQSGGAVILNHKGKAVCGPADLEGKGRVETLVHSLFSGEPRRPGSLPSKIARCHPQHTADLRCIPIELETRQGTEAGEGKGKECARFEEF